MKKSVCIISFSKIQQDARVLRQIKHLAPHYDLTVIGYGSPPLNWDHNPAIRWVPIRATTPPLLTKIMGLLLVLGKVTPRLYELWYWHTARYKQAFEQAVANRYDLYYANDWEALPLAAEAAHRNEARLIFDVHEYAPLEFENSWRWRWVQAPLVGYFLQAHAAQIDATITVAPPIAARYKEEFSLDPVVTVLNTPDPVTLPAKTLQPDRIRLIHHGIAHRERGLERMIETIALCDERYSLHFMLLDNNPTYLRELKKLAEQYASKRVYFHEPVAPEAIVPTISRYDMGFYLIAPSSYNNRVALPNKFFDFINAGLAVCIGPSPAMAEIVHEFQLGCVAPTFCPEDVARVLNDLQAGQLTAMQEAARAAARRYNAEAEMGKVIALHRQLLAEDA